MRIALAVPALDLGGGVPAVARFIKDAALRAGHELRLVSLSMDSRDPCSTRLRSPRSWFRGVTLRKGEWDGLPFTHVGAAFGEFEFQQYKPRDVLTRLVADCDVIQVVCGSPAWANAVCGLGKPVSLQVATRARVERRERDGNSHGPIGWWRRGMTAITNRMDDRALRRVDAIQVENPWMLDYARSLNQGRAVDIRYAPPGVDATAFQPATARDLVHDPYILCVGRLNDPRKNIGLLLDAYLHLPANLVATTRMVLAGKTAPPRDFWAGAANAGVAGRITFVEQPGLAELVRLYQGASVFALPSDEEGFGVVVIEAMACGIPVVATRCGGPDGIITEGRDGYLVDRGDAQALAERLVLLLTDARMNERMGKAACGTIAAQYDEHVAGQAFLAAWSRLM